MLDIAMHAAARKLVQGLNFHVMETQGWLVVLMEIWNRRGVFYNKSKHNFLHHLKRFAVPKVHRIMGQFSITSISFLYVLHKKFLLNTIVMMAAKKLT